MKTKVFQTRSILLALVLLTPWVARAGEITDNYADGDRLTATTMNNIKAAVNDNDTNIGANATAISNNAADISTNDINIGINSAAITDHESRLTVLESAPGVSIGADIVVEPASTVFPAGDSSLKEVASISVVAPSSGIVIVTHSGTATFFGDAATIEVGIGDSNIAMDTSLSHFGRLDGAGTDRLRLPYTVQNIYNVTAGTNTFYGLARKTFDGGVSINIIPQSITAIFLPNRI